MTPDERALLHACMQAEIEAAWKAGHAPARLLQIGGAQ